MGAGVSKCKAARGRGTIEIGVDKCGRFVDKRLKSMSRRSLLIPCPGRSRIIMDVVGERVW